MNTNERSSIRPTPRCQIRTRLRPSYRVGNVVASSYWCSDPHVTGGSRSCNSSALRMLPSSIRETPNAHMHVATLALYDQSTAPGGRVRFRDILAQHRTTAASRKVFPAQTRRSAGRNRSSVLDRGSKFRSRVPRAPRRVAAARRLEAVLQAGGAAAFISARSQQAAVGADGHQWTARIAGVPDGAFGLLLKIHHAAIDGASGAALTEVLHDLSATPGEIPPPQTVWSGEPEPAPFDLMSRSAMNNFMQPFRAAEIWSQTVPALRRAADTFRARPVDPVGPVPRTRFNGRVTPHRVFDGRRIGSTIASASNKAVEGATINDVDPDCRRRCAAHATLTEKGELPNDVVDCDGADQCAHGR